MVCGGLQRRAEKQEWDNSILDKLQLLWSLLGDVLLIMGKIMTLFLLIVNRKRANTISFLEYMEIFFTNFRPFGILHHLPQNGLF